MVKTIYSSLKYKIYWHYASPHSIIRIGMGKRLHTISWCTGGPHAWNPWFKTSVV